MSASHTYSDATIFINGKPLEGVTVTSLTFREQIEEDRAADPNSKPLTLVRLAHVLPDLVEQNPALPLLALEYPAAWRAITTIIAFGRLDTKLRAAINAEHDWRRQRLIACAFGEHVVKELISEEFTGDLLGCIAWHRELICAKRWSWPAAKRLLVEQTYARAHIMYGAYLYAGMAAGPPAVDVPWWPHNTIWTLDMAHRALTIDSDHLDGRMRALEGLVAVHKRVSAGWVR